MISILIAGYLCCQPLMKMSECRWLFEMFQIYNIVLPPKFHFLMPAYAILYVRFYKKFLVHRVHVVNYIFDIERGWNQTQWFYAWIVMLQKISQDKVSAQACSNYMQVWVWIMNLHPSDRFLKFMKSVSYEGYGAGHLAVDTSSI